MSKVKFKFSFKELTFEYEGDHDTGRVISQAMQNTLGSLAQAQNAVIDVTDMQAATEPALPPPPPTLPAPKRRGRKSKPRTVNGVDAGTPSPEIQPDPVKQTKSRRPRAEGFRAQTYRLLNEGYFSIPRTAADIQAEHAKRGFTYETKNLASELTDFTKKSILSREQNSDGKYAYVKGSNNEFPRS